jgi:hypothetical protein
VHAAGHDTLFGVASHETGGQRYMLRNWASVASTAEVRQD